MKLAVFEINNRTMLGEIEGETIHGLAWPDSNTRQLIRRGITPSRAYERFPLEKVTLKAPINPGKILAVGRNYAEHAGEMGGSVPQTPIIFAKLPSAIIASKETIVGHTSVTQEIDWEVELAVVIGRPARRVSEADALNHVFGYTIANDVTARDLQRNTEQPWTLAKGIDTFCPLGPVIVTRDQIADPQALSLRTLVNGDIMQDSSTANMVFSVAQLIAFISRSVTLESGDVILTGTPSGVGSGMKPPRYLKDGDIVQCTIDGIGDLTNPVKIIDDAAS